MKHGTVSFTEASGDLLASTVLGGVGAVGVVPELGGGTKGGETT